MKIGRGRKQQMRSIPVQLNVFDQEKKVEATDKINKVRKCGSEDELWSALVPFRGVSQKTGRKHE